MYAWIDCGNGRQVYKKIDERDYARSDLPMPMVMSDHIDPVVSMADGNTYSSKSALRATYLPSGNPHGERYVEVGNDPIRPHPKPKSEGIKEAIQTAIQQVGGI